MRDDKFAARTGRNVFTVKNKRVQLGIRIFQPKWRPWQPEEDKLLGTASDGAIGLRLGRDRGVVQKRRRELGIPPHGDSPWTPKETAWLGTASDEEIARRLRRTATSVKNLRHRLRIPAWRK